MAAIYENKKKMRGRRLYHEQINKKTLEFLLQKKGGTVEEYIEFFARQVLPFTPEEEKQVQDTMVWMSGMLSSHGLKLPDLGPITFFKNHL